MRFQMYIMLRSSPSSRESWLTFSNRILSATRWRKRVEYRFTLFAIDALHSMKSVDLQFVSVYFFSRKRRHTISATVDFQAAQFRPDIIDSIGRGGEIRTRPPA